MDIKRVKGETRIKLTKPEQKKLADAREILEGLAENGQDGAAADALEALTVVMDKYCAGNSLAPPEVADPEAS